MNYIQPIIFLLVVLALGAFSFKKYSEIYRNIKRGKSEKIEGDVGARLTNVLLIAFGQKKMFKNWIPAVLHLFIYVAFMVTQIELIEIFIDGVTGAHRIFAPYLGGFYTFIISFIEILSVLALVATFAFLSRRNLLKVPRLTMSEMNGWPKLDGNLILYGELWLVTCIFCMNGADVVLQSLDPAHYPSTGFLAVSGWLGPALFGGLDVTTLKIIERFGWWGHILGVFGFIAYLPYSKHLHIMLAFPNTYYASLEEKGKMRNMPEITQEVKLMMDPNAPMPEEDPNAEPVGFGAKDVDGLSWKSLLDAYSCTECGRCTAACPANGTGKLLSPRAIMMRTRDRMEDLTKFEQANDGNSDDGKSLLGDYISKEEINACTTCNACVEECPVSINPLNIITELRRYTILEAADSPEEWNLMFGNVENNGAVWQFNPQDRAKWVDEL